MSKKESNPLPPKIFKQGGMSIMIELGDVAEDTITGFKGVVIAKSEYLNGCKRYAVQSQKLKDGRPGEPEWIDSQQVKLVSKGFGGEKKQDDPETRPGGPQFKPMTQGNPKF